MPLDSVLVHRGVPLRRTGEAWVEGHKVPGGETPGTPFDCCLFLPKGTEDTVIQMGRQVSEPTLLYAPEDDAAQPIGLKPEDAILITAPELNAARGMAANAQERWQVVGAPQPFGKPGEDVLGFQATLRLVTE